MGVVFSLLLRLDATAVCVAVFVLALASLWLYVTLAKPSHSSREYERLERLLNEDAGKAASSPASVTGGGGGGGARREGKRGRGRGKAVSAELRVFTRAER